MLVAAQCMGPSMLPTFNTRGDVLMLEHFSTQLGRISVGAGLLLALPWRRTAWQGGHMQPASLKRMALE